MVEGQTSTRTFLRQDRQITARLLRAETDRCTQLSFRWNPEVPAMQMASNLKRSNRNVSRLKTQPRWRKNLAKLRRIVRILREKNQKLKVPQRLTPRIRQRTANNVPISFVTSAVPICWPSWNIPWMPQNYGDCTRFTLSWTLTLPSILGSLNSAVRDVSVVWVVRVSFCRFLPPNSFPHFSLEQPKGRWFTVRSAKNMVETLRQSLDGLLLLCGSCARSSSNDVRCRHSFLASTRLQREGAGQDWQPSSLRRFHRKRCPASVECFKRGRPVR